MKNTWQLKVSLFLISLCTLCLEILHIRIFGYTVAPVMSYCAISFAMLGFAGGAAVLSIFPGILKWDVTVTLLQLAILFAVSVFFSAFLLTLLPASGDEIKTPGFSTNITFFFLLPSLLPYLLAGLMIAIFFSILPGFSGEIYFINLLGSALGCLIPLALLRSVGVEILISMVVLGGIAASFPLMSPLKKPARAGIVLAAALVAIFLPTLSRTIFTFRPDTSDQISVLSRVLEKKGQKAPVIEYSQWDPVGRIEVYRVPDSRIKVPIPTDYRIITVDAGASTLIINPPRAPGWGKELFEESLYGIGYHVSRPNPDVLVIGVGGGTDIHAALHWNANSVTGVEISRTTIDLLEKRYRDYTGIFAAPGDIELVHADGRNYSKNTKKNFDLIQLTGVDTLTLSSPGAMVLVEDYLYTVEAFRDFLSILKPEGILVVLRFDKEAFNLGMIAYQALKTSGVKNPFRHLAVFNQNRLSGVVVKKAPFNARQIEALENTAKRTSWNDISIPHYDMYGLRLGRPVNILFLPSEKYFAKLPAKLDLTGKKLDDTKAAAMDIFTFKIPTDDRPYYMAGRMFKWLKKGKAVHSITLIRNTWIAILILSSFFLFLPLLSKRGTYPLKLSSLLLLLFFLSIAVGFMFIEIGLIQKTIIYIGHPGGSASLVLAAMLLGSGFGSYLSGRLKIPPLKLIVIIAPVTFTLIVIYALSGELMFQHLARCDSLSRWLSCCLLIALAAVPMGFLFPSGLRVVSRKYKPLLPWAIAVNGSGSASSLVIALPIGIFSGHRFLIIAGAFCYLLALAFMFLYGMREKAWKAT